MPSNEKHLENALVASEKNPLAGATQAQILEKDWRKWNVHENQKQTKHFKKTRLWKGRGVLLSIHLLR